MTTAVESMLLLDSRQLPPSEGATSKPLVQCLAGSYNLVIVCWTGISYIFQIAVLPQIGLRQRCCVFFPFFFQQPLLFFLVFHHFSGVFYTQEFPVTPCSLRLYCSQKLLPGSSILSSFLNTPFPSNYVTLNGSIV